MVKEVVKYIPGDKENGKLEKVLHVGNKIELSRLSLMLSALSLLLAVVFFSLLLGWLWGIPNLVDKHQQEVERLEHLIEKQDIIIQSLMGNQEKDGSLLVPEKLGSVKDEFDVRSCLQDPSSGPCTTLSIQRWFFDRKAGRCKQFSFGGCEGNQNNFITARDCEEKCSGVKKDEVLDLISKADIKSVAGGEIFSNSLDEKPTHCFLEPAAGPCRGQVSRFYWDEEKMTCSKFFYGGCAGNKNNFITEQDCRNTCWIQTSGGGFSDMDKCKLEPNPGQCSEKISRWYYDEWDGCLEFEWSGCGGNANNFNSKERCDEVCGLSPEIDAPVPVEFSEKNIKNIEKKQTLSLKIKSGCFEPLAVGDCRGAFKKFYYNSSTGKCDEFVYGGCGGNKNNFIDEETCKNTCIVN